MEKLIIKTDITDWKEEALRDENIVQREEDLFNMIDRGVMTGKIARSAIVSRELGKAPTDIIAPNKLLLYTGALASLSEKIRERTIELTTESGKTFSVPAYIGKPGRPKQESEDEEQETGDGIATYVHTDSVHGLERSYNYLVNVVPGHVFNALKTIALNSGDVESAVEDLKVKIDEMVERLE